MSTREERLAAGRQVFVRVVLDDAKACDVDARDRVEPLLAPGEAIAAELPDGARIGSVKRNKPARYPKVVDEMALLDWVRRNRPDELIEIVRPSFVEALKVSCREHGLPVDKTSGEVIPGIELVEGAAAYRPVVDEAARPMLRAKLAELIAGGLLELPSAEEGAT